MLGWIKDRGRGTFATKATSANYQGVEVELNPNIWGPNMRSYSTPIAFVFNQGGVGDYINWASAIKWIHETYTHVDGRVYVSELFLRVAEYLFADYPRWKVIHRDKFPAAHERGAPICNPAPSTQLINACGAHLMDLGYWYFSCVDPVPGTSVIVPKDLEMLEIKYEGPWKWPELDPNSDFALFTPGCTSEVREMPVKAFNELVDYTIKKGITPVFLGKRELSENYEAKFLHYDLSRGIDLRERTDLIEATQLMRKARFILGIDNGLLHMAGTTDCPTIFGHNVAPAVQRHLRRRKGFTVNITVPETELPCIGCQSKMRFMPNGHDFRQCFWKKHNPEKDRICLSHLFKNDSKEWKAAIDKVLSQKGRRK